MATHINRAFVMGNVGKDPEIKSFQDGNRVANFSIATTENWKDKATGDRKERTQWLNIAVFNQPLVILVDTPGFQIGTEAERSGNLSFTVFHLVTFGALGIEADNGATPPRLRPPRLALLAVLAAAGHRGVSREKLTALFWPDSDEERARHSLLPGGRLP